MNIYKIVAIPALILALTTSTAIAGGNGKQNPPLIEESTGGITSKESPSNWYDSFLDFFGL